MGAWLDTLDRVPHHVKDRFHWTAPLGLDPFDEETGDYGCQMILRTTNGGVSWTEISPDLSTKDPSRIVSSGGVVGASRSGFGVGIWSMPGAPVRKALVSWG